MVKDEKYLIDLIHYLVKFPKETEWLEFKTNYFQADEIGKYISALSNSATLYEKNSGYMIWGIDDETHDIVGTTFDYEDHITNMKLEEYLNFFMPKLNNNQIKELVEKCRKDISPRIMEKYLTPELNEFLIFSKNYGEPVDMILQYAKILYEHLVHFVEERHLMHYSPLIAINNLYTNIDSLHNNEIGLVYGYLKQAIDLNFLVNLSQDTIMLKICKFCHKAFIPKNSKAEYDTPQCKNKANVYSFIKRAHEEES